MSKKWDGKRLAALAENAGISYPQLSMALGLTMSTINGYMQGKNRPSLDSLVALADFFAVPTDYLVGRCTDEQARAILDNYPEHFMELRRAPYEAYLVAGRKPICSTRYSEYESPWPYNLADAIIGEPIDWILHEDHIAALNHALSVLTERERMATLLHYQYGRSLEAIGREFNLTRERIRQIIDRAVKKMQHPSNVRALREGLGMVEQQEDREAYLRELDAQIAWREQRLEKLKAEVPEEKPAGLMLSVYDLGLSVRSTNCLWRAGYDTLGKVLDAAEGGKLKRVRNMGRKSLDEVLRMLYERTGLDFHEANA